MIKFLTLFFFMSINAGSGEKTQCQQSFSASELSSLIQRIQETQLPLVGQLYGKRINSSLMKQIHQGLKDMQEKFKNNKQKDSHLKILNPQLSKAIDQVPAIVRFIDKNFSTNSPEVNHYEKMILESILVTFSKHVPTYLDSSIPSSSKDWGRIQLILETIAQFDSKKGHFSLYKIKRAIIGKHSLREYILCK